MLQALVNSLAFRGPDGSAIWSEGPIGLGHAMLRTTFESTGENQPANLDGRYWITADARIDCQDELKTLLERAGRAVRTNAPDSELIVHAYAVWGMACVEHLRGDFAFGIWDARGRSLFCARDHFGIKPFYYAQRGDSLLFSNTLNCVRMHPQVSEELNDAAIGDFLLFGLNYDEATTAFRDVQRLPPAHCLTFGQNGLQIRRYWAPPADGRIRHQRAEEYIEQFQNLLEAAVADRMRTERVGILLSGGLDSSSVVAVAKEVSAQSTQGTDIRAYTSVYQSLIPDREGDYAREAGEFLRIPVKFLELDEVQIFERWDDPGLSTPEPVDNPLFAGFLDSCRNISADCRVLLSGEGCDNLMEFEMRPHVRDLWRRREWQQLLSDLANYVWVRPFPWRGIRARARKLIGRNPEQVEYPGWLNAEFVRRVNLEARWKEWSEHPPLKNEHPILPKAHASLFLPHWTNMFEQEDPGTTHYPVEVRYPFLDLRVVNYLLALPPFPWFFEKMLLREAMAGRLPERVRVRPKAALQGDPVSAQLRRTGVGRVNSISWSPIVERYIDRARLVEPHGKMGEEQANRNFRPYCLNNWLQCARRVRYNMHAEAGNG